VPAQVGLSGQASATSRLQVVTQAHYAMASKQGPEPQPLKWQRIMGMWLAPGLFGCVLLQNKKRLRVAIGGTCILACGLLIAGCGSSSSSRSSQKAQPQTYNISVTASSGNVVHSTTLQLTLQ
jgi:hypothetical protein